MQSSCVLWLRAENDEELAAAGSRTVYRRYLRRFICVIPRVHGGYFKSSLRVIHRVHWERLTQFLSEEGFFKTSRSRQRRSSGRKGSGSQSHTPAGTAKVGLGLRLETEFLGATLKTVLARLEWPLGAI